VNIPAAQKKFSVSNVAFSDFQQDASTLNLTPFRFATLGLFGMDTHFR
jgi:hypothetical protein